MTVKDEKIAKKAAKAALRKKIRLTRDEKKAADKEAKMNFTSESSTTAAEDSSASKIDSKDNRFETSTTGVGSSRARGGGGSEDSGSAGGVTGSVAGEIGTLENKRDTNFGAGGAGDKDDNVGEDVAAGSGAGFAAGGAGDGGGGSKGGSGAEEVNDGEGGVAAMTDSSFAACGAEDDGGTGGDANCIHIYAEERENHTEIALKKKTKERADSCAAIHSEVAPESPAKIADECDSRSLGSGCGGEKCEVSGCSGKEVDEDQLARAFSLLTASNKTQNTASSKSKEREGPFNLKTESTVPLEKEEGKMASFWSTAKAVFGGLLKWAKTLFTCLTWAQDPS